MRRRRLHLALRVGRRRRGRRGHKIELGQRTGADRRRERAEAVVGKRVLGDAQVPQVGERAAAGGRLQRGERAVVEPIVLEPQVAQVGERAAAERAEERGGAGRRELVVAQPQLVQPRQRAADCVRKGGDAGIGDAILVDVQL